MLADSKYANLMGIAYDQPDLYETSDLPEADQPHNDDVEESECIERTNINATEAFSKFKGKIVDASNIDFSDKLSKKRRIGYDTRFGNWELVATGEKETILQRYNRLKCEIQELLEDVSSLKEDESKEFPNESVAYQADQMLLQLENLKLEKYLGSQISKLSDPEGVKVKKLLSHLESLGTTRSSGSGDSKLTDNRVTFTINSGVAQNQLNQMSRIADLEGRINRLHKIIGSHEGEKSIGGKGLLETARMVSQKVTLLEPAHLEAAEVRIKSLLNKIKQIDEKNKQLQNSLNPDIKKIQELHELVKASQYHANLLPQIMDRLVALEALHKQGSEFSKCLSELEANQEHLKEKLHEADTTLHSIEKNMKTNDKAFNSTISDINDRISALNVKK